MFPGLRCVFARLRSDFARLRDLASVPAFRFFMADAFRFAFQAFRFSLLVLRRPFFLVLLPASPGRVALELRRRRFEAGPFCFRLFPRLRLLRLSFFGFVLLLIFCFRPFFLLSLFRRFGQFSLGPVPNDASNGLHRAMGFVPVGTYRRIGWKAGTWHDVQWWQLDLRPNEAGPPDEIHTRVPSPAHLA
jgi:hypothetical protein